MYKSKNNSCLNKLDYSLKTCEDRVALVNKLFKIDSSFTDGFNEPYNPHISQSDPLSDSLEDSVVLQQIADYILMIEEGLIC